MKPNNYVTDEDIRAKWDNLTAKQQQQLNDAYKRSTVALTNLPKYVDTAQAPAVITNKRDKRLWPKMTPQQRKRAILQIKDHALMGVNIAGALSGED